ncbi:MAG: hypothetical protein EKK57_08325 [Proteobacteria bacterium]|nr:MAG: hypothetical protein EKK57_08325 [Pseudomonadota bacterium]
MNTLWILSLLLFTVLAGFAFHYYSEKVVNNLVSILNLLTMIGDQLNKVNTILIEKANLEKGKDG